jgi:hypothetical protein
MNRPFPPLIQKWVCEVCPMITIIIIIYIYKSITGKKSQDTPKGRTQGHTPKKRTRQVCQERVGKPILNQRGGLEVNGIFHTIYGLSLIINTIFRHTFRKLHFKILAADFKL